MGKKTEQPARQLNSEQRNQLRVTLLTSSEGCLLLIGVALTFAYLLWLGYKLLFSPEESQVLTGMTATGIVFGRAAGMAFGYSLGLENSTVIPISRPTRARSKGMVSSGYLFSSGFLSG